ncbi:hypothetical protein [Dechloromonas sp. A34]|uniref:hypothetical protein n=1 Tax=Dechloromonas sp. A34 TaxID=447588 RepID=UPI0022492E4F|nr:hypothetical protein [Dechloromonas sp. A34]
MAVQLAACRLEDGQELRFEPDIGVVQENAAIDRDEGLIEPGACIAVGDGPCGALSVLIKSLSGMLSPGAVMNIDPIIDRPWRRPTN